MQSSAHTESIKIDYTQLIQVEMPIVFGGLTEMELMQMGIWYCLQALVYSSLVLDSVYPDHRWSSYSKHRCIHTAFIRYIVIYKFSVISLSK